MLLFVQVHICRASYILPTGQICKVCPEISTCEEEPAKQVVLTDKHGDCHDCCQLQGCDDSGKVKAPATVSIHSLAIDLPPLPVVAIPVPLIGIQAVNTYIEGAPPTGPPCLTRSRAPPFQLA